MKKNSLLLLLMITAVSCLRPAKELDFAEAIMTERPDSALSLLLNWQQTHPSSSPKIQARYSLLLSMALDKNYIDIASDSIIRPAVEYFAPRKGRNRMLTFYYQGLVYLNMESFIASIVSLEQAEIEAMDLHDWFYWGLSNRSMAYIFSEVGNNASALACIDKSIEGFCKSQAKIHEQYAQLSKAIILHNSQNYEESEKILNILLHSVSSPVDSNLTYQCMLRHASNLKSLQRSPEFIIPLYKSIPQSYLYCLDYGDIALLYERIGQRDSADIWMSAAYESAKSDAEKATLDYKKGKIEGERGNYKRAYKLIDHACAFQDSLTRVRLTESASSAQRDYFRQEMYLEKERTRTAAVKLQLWATVFILSIAILVLLFVIRLNRNESKIKESLASLHSQESLLQKLQQDNAFLLGSLLSEKLLYLDKLSDDFCNTDSDADKEIIFRRYKEAINSLKENKAIFSEIEELLNRHCNGFTNKFREQFPQITGEKLDMAIMFFTRLPYKTIQLFFRYHNAESLRQSKTRLRKSILDSDAPDKMLFLDMLEIKKGGRRKKQNDV